MKNMLYSWSICFFIIIIIDGIWLSISAPRFYKIHLADIMTADFNYVIAFTFYLLYAFAISYLVIMPHLANGSSALQALVSGAILGMAAYGAYDLTNHATIKNWPAIVTVVDMAWGTFVTAISTAITYKIMIYVNS
jgi:uncharacterized membrane protein